MPDFKLTDVDSKIIENTANSIGDYIKELQSISTVFSSGTMVNLNPYWQGPAKESFENQFINYSATFKQLIDEYESLNNQLKTAGKNYDQADERVAQLIAKMPK